jgi:hypothetical protein
MTVFQPKTVVNGAVSESKMFARMVEEYMEKE